MSFAAPAFLALAALVGVILYLHSQRQRRRVVGSLQLWRQLQLPDGSRRARRYLPPLSVELVLQVAAALALALALAQPFLGRARAPDHLVIVMDASADMAVLEEGRARLDLAGEELGRMLGTPGRIGPERVSMVVSGVVPRLEAARWPWHRDALAGPLTRLRGSDGPADWQATGRLLAGLLRPGEDTTVLFVSDRAAPADLREVIGEARLIEQRIGTVQPRLHLSGTVEPETLADGIWRIAGSVLLEGDWPEGAFADAAEDGVDSGPLLEIAYASDAGAAELPWADLAPDLDAAGRAGFAATLDLPGPGILTVTQAGPGIAGDTLRFVLPDGPEALEVLYLGAGEQPLLAALRAIEGVEIFQADTLPADVARFGLVVVDGVAVPRAPETNTVWIGAARVEGAEEPPVMQAPDPDGWDNAHPLARDIDWAALRIPEARAVVPEPLAETLLASGDVSLVQAWTQGTGRGVRLAFNPADSNWPEQSSFALFAAGLVDWLGLRPGVPLAPACEVGRRCPLDARLRGSMLVPVDPPHGAAVVLDDPVGFLPEWAGLFRIGDGDAARYLAVNAAPRGEVAASADDPSPAAGAAALPRSWTPWLLGLAAALLAADALLAARRKRRFGAPAPLALAATGMALAAALNLPAPVSQAREVLTLILPPALGETGGQDASPQIAALLAADRSSVITTGAGAEVSADAGEGALGAAAGPGPTPDGAAALALAQAMQPDGQTARIVLAADLTTASPAVSLGARPDLTIDRLPAAPPVVGEVLVRGVELPHHVVAGDALTLIGIVHAQRATEAELRILRDGDVLASQAVSLSAGNNRIEATLPDVAAGEVLVEMEIDAPGDTYAENNRAGRIVTARAARPIAVIAPSADHGRAFAAMLAGAGVDAVVLDPRSAPHYQRGWLEYGGIVLLNMPAIALSTRQQGLIETAVAEHGLGLLILGGPNSFGPGGYFETALERVSPLSSRIPREAPEVAMVFVLDRSGSMQQPVGEGNRLDIAKRATLAAVELLNPASQIGIVVFDAEATAILPLGELDIDSARAALGSVDPGGGTSIYPGLVAAYEMLRGVEAPARHIVVMTDGLSQPGDFPGIIGQIRAEGITASAVAVGTGSDISTVEMIAGLGGGAAHASLDFEALPSILSQEAMLLSEPIEEMRSQPSWLDTDAPFLVGLPDPMPPVEGFVLTTAKPQARLAMTTPDTEDRDMPLLAWWRYGNGSVLALSTDATGAWSRNWHALDSYSTMWSRILRQFLPPTAAPGLHLTVDGDGETMHVTLTAFDEEGAPQSGMSVSAAVTAPDGTPPMNMPLREDRAGLYRSGLLLGAPGRYEVSVAVDGAPAEVVAAFHHSYPVRYDLARPGGAADRLMAATGGGERDAAGVLAASAGVNWVWRGAWPVWALAALGLFMAELVRRYAGIGAQLGAGLGRVMPGRGRKISQESEGSSR